MLKFLFTGILAIGGHYSFFSLTKFEKEIFVKEKQIITQGYINKFIIIDKNNDKYRCVNCIWDLPFSKFTNFDHLKEGQRYKIKGYGLTTPAITQIYGNNRNHNFKYDIFSYLTKKDLKPSLR